MSDKISVGDVVVSKTAIYADKRTWPAGRIGTVLSRKNDTLVCKVFSTCRLVAGDYKVDVTQVRRF